MLTVGKKSLILFFIVFTPVAGIDEAPKEEEQSPDPKLKNRLPEIKEETKEYTHLTQKDKESRITFFLDKMKIKQVFPSEINVMKLLYHK